MKGIILFLAFVFSFYSFANFSLPNFSGKYEVSGKKIAILQIKHSLSVFHSNSTGKIIINDLKTLGYDCLRVTNFITQCGNFITESEYDSEALNRAYLKNKGAVLSFKETHLTPTMTNDSVSVKEWSLNQEASFRNTNFQKINFIYLTEQNILKFNLENTLAHKEHFNIADQIISKRDIINIEAKRPQDLIIRNNYTILVETIFDLYNQ
jgi:hypothetical protein